MFISGRSMGLSGLLLVLLIGLFFISSRVHGADGVGLVTLLRGEVVRVADAGKLVSARPFEKMRAGDRYRLSPGASLRLVFFQNGRQEQWNGPAELEMGHEGGLLVSGAGKMEPAVSSFSQDMAKRVEKVANIADSVRHQKTGATVVRGKGDSESLIEMPLLPREKEIVDAAREEYQQLVEEMKEDDIVPELYLFSIMADYDQFREMERLIERMREKQPENEGIGVLADWVAGQR